MAHVCEPSNWGEAEAEDYKFQYISDNLLTWRNCLKIKRAGKGSGFELSMKALSSSPATIMHE